jgi:hypothetical protein
MAMARIYWDRENYPMVRQTTRPEFEVTPRCLALFDLTMLPLVWPMVARRRDSWADFGGAEPQCLLPLLCVCQVEKLFRQSAEFCSEHEVWKLNVAHVFFMQVTGTAARRQSWQRGPFALGMKGRIIALPRWYSEPCRRPLVWLLVPGRRPSSRTRSGTTTRS